MSGDGVVDLDQTFPTADGELAGPCIQCGTPARATTQHGNAACSAWPDCPDIGHVETDPTVPAYMYPDYTGGA